MKETLAHGYRQRERTRERGGGKEDTAKGTRIKIFQVFAHKSVSSPASCVPTIRENKLEVRVPYPLQSVQGLAPFLLEAFMRKTASATSFVDGSEPKQVHMLVIQERS